MITVCQSNLSGALASQQSIALHSVPWNCAPVSLQDYICSRSLWLSPHQLSKSHLLSYPVVTCGAPVWQSVLVGWLHTKTLSSTLVLTCHLMFSIIHKCMWRTRWIFKNPSLSQSCGIGHALLPILPKLSFYKVRSMMLSWCFPISRKTYLSS